MPRVLVIDTVYPDFLKSLPFDPNSTYEVELQKVLDRKFGTADFYSRNLKALGHECVDVIANHIALQQMWEEHFDGKGRTGLQILAAQLHQYRPDVVFLQDLSLDIDRREYPFEYLADRLVAAQCSCPWPGDDKIRRCDVIFTSFPHYVKRIEALGVRAIYNPLAFEPSVLEHFPTYEYCKRTGQELERPHDCVFIGGVGNPSHWKYGMEVLETVAREIPTFKWWGYGVETLPADSALRAKYQGSAFGLDMYEILLQSKICLNRHGEVAEGFSNNMRMYEATGCGALLLTEYGINLSDLFACSPKMHAFGEGEVATYESPDEAVDKIRYYLQHEDERAAIAARGQKRTLEDHTYAKRMKVVSDTLQEMLCPA